MNYEPARGTVSSWGDSYGNRVDRFLACIAYLDGSSPSVVMARGYYTRTVLVAWDWRDGTLTRRWTFDSNDSGNSGYAGQGNHNLAVADVDNDGRDEIVYGSMTIDHDGSGLYTTGLGHGDAMHVGDLGNDMPTPPTPDIILIGENSSQNSDDTTPTDDSNDETAICDNPVEITVPFSQNGAGEYCWVTSDNISYINSWNMDLVEINGSDFTDIWSNQMPDSIDGNYYIHYIGSYAWSYLEVNGGQ